MKRKRISLTFVSILLLTYSSQAQYAYDALRFSEINQTGTARFQAVGGNHAALGGDASSISGNPAGLGFYNRSELSISPGLGAVTADSKFNGSLTTDKKITGNLTNLSLVIANSARGYASKWKRTSFGISFSRQQSFSSKFSYADPKSTAPFIDYIVKKSNDDKVSIADLEKEYDNQTGYAVTPEAAYYQLYMLNPTTQTGPPYESFDAANPQEVNQIGFFEASGAHSQWNFAYAGNYDDKLYLGLSVGINRIKYSYTNTLTDQFAAGQQFSTSSHIETFDLDGNGFNATLGAIYKVSSILQIGTSVSTPTFTMSKETFGERVTANNDFIDLNPNDFQYNLTSPFRATGGVTLFAGQKGFITGTVEYVGYRGMRVRNSDNPNFGKTNNDEIKDLFSNVVNARIGGEYRAGLFRARLGLAYYSDPYTRKPNGVDRSKLFVSGGAGIRTDRFFADLTGTYGAKTTFVPPYSINYIESAQNQVTTQTFSAVLTMGVFF